MCYICNSSPHTVSCPFDKRASAMRCAVCGSSIFDGEISYKLKDELFHKECLRELNGMDVIEVLEIKPQ